jgi:hypothetical protein
MNSKNVRAPRPAHPPQPRVERLAVELARVGSGPRRLGRHRAREPVQPRAGLLVVEQDHRVDARDDALVAAQRSAPLDDALAGGVGLEGVDAQLARELDEAVLGRADPLPADLDDLAGVLGRQRLVERPPADAVARLEDDDRRARGDGGARRGQARQAGS